MRSSASCRLAFRPPIWVPRLSPSVAEHVAERRALRREPAFLAGDPVRRQRACGGGDQASGRTAVRIGGPDHRMPLRHAARAARGDVVVASASGTSPASLLLGKAAANAGDRGSPDTCTLSRMAIPRTTGLRRRCRMSTAPTRRSLRSDELFQRPRTDVVQRRSLRRHRRPQASAPTRTRRRR